MMPNQDSHQYTYPGNQVKDQCTAHRFVFPQNQQTSWHSWTCCYITYSLVMLTYLLVINLPIRYTDYLKRSFSNSGAYLGNNLPENVQKITFLVQFILEMIEFFEYLISPRQWCKAVSFVVIVMSVLFVTMFILIFLFLRMVCVLLLTILPCMRKFFKIIMINNRDGMHVYITIFLNDRKVSITRGDSTMAVE